MLIGCLIASFALKIPFFKKANAKAVLDEARNRYDNCFQNPIPRNRKAATTFFVILLVILVAYIPDCIVCLLDTNFVIPVKVSDTVSAFITFLLRFSHVSSIQLSIPA